MTLIEVQAIAVGALKLADAARRIIELCTREERQPTPEEIEGLNQREQHEEDRLAAHVAAAKAQLAREAMLERHNIVSRKDAVEN